MRPAEKKTTVNWPRLSGPHICMGAGQQALDFARKSLHSAAEMRGGKLSDTEISAVFDLVAASQEMFEIYRSNYEACGRIHKKQPFVGANKDFFAVSVLRFLSFDVLRKVFDAQMKRADGAWEMEFLHAFSGYICRTADAEFVDSLSKAYRKLAKTHGNTITAVTIAGDKTIQEVLRKVMAAFPKEHIDFVNFSNAVNKALSEKYESYGPSPIKVSEPVIERFFEALRSSANGNFFRQAVLG